jgi:UDP-GlcNAc:undecaprenyl-phosphate GlcNAc-1-phosphate transferase
MSISYLFAAVFSLVVCLAAHRIGLLLGVLDSPDGVRKTHKVDTPLVGGVASALPFIGTAIYFGSQSGYAPLYLTLAAVTGGSLILGYVDDRGHIKPVWRLVFSAAICGGALYAVPALRVEAFTFSFMGLPIFLYSWASLFTMICLVGLQNAVNMADGRNGLVLGLSLIWVFCLLAYAPSHLTPLLAVLAISMSVAFPFNLRGRLFIGDSGAYALSTGIGILTIYIYGVKFSVLSADVIALWFLIPILDCLRLMVIRVLSGRSPFNSDQNHLHHILNNFVPWNCALMFYLLVVAVPAGLAYTFPDKTLLWVFLTVMAYGVLIFVTTRGLTERRLGTL